MTGNTYYQDVKSVILTLKDRTGTSRQAITKQVEKIRARANREFDCLVRLVQERMHVFPVLVTAEMKHQYAAKRQNLTLTLSFCDGFVDANSLQTERALPNLVAYTLQIVRVRIRHA